MRAWLDPGSFGRRLLGGRPAAATELGITTTNSTTHTKLLQAKFKVAASAAPGEQPRRQHQQQEHQQERGGKGVHNPVTCFPLGYTHSILLVAKSLKSTRKSQGAEQRIPQNPRRWCLSERVGLFNLRVKSSGEAS